MVTQKEVNKYLTSLDHAENIYPLEVRVAEKFDVSINKANKFVENWHK